MYLEIHVVIAVVAFGVYHPTAAAQLNAHGETAEPAQKLKPRNYNPHPYARDFSEISDNDLQSPPSGGGSSSAASDIRGNHVKRRQSPALFNQGPIQFPSNNDVGEVAPVNNRRISVGVGTRLFQAQRPATAAPDYDDYDQQSVGTYNKKHYAFSYVVRDHESGDDFSHSQQQQQNGAVQGSYKVQLPDGRTQVVKYTADEGGYKADVSYIEDNHIASTHQAHHPTPTQSSISPHLLAAEPIYKYYKTLQDNQQQQQQQQQQPQPTQYVLHQPQLQRSHLNYASLSGGYTIPAVAATPAAFAPRHHGHLIATPSTAYHRQQQQQRHPQPTQSTLQYVQNVQIDTYQTAPHLQQQQLHQVHQYQQQPPLVQPTRIVFPSAPTPYQDIHVLPSPRPHPFAASTAPFVAADQHRLRLSPKNTNIVSSPATLLVRPGHGALAPASYNYLDYDYQQQGPQQPAQQLVFVATQATPVEHHQQGVHHQQANGGVVLQPNQALYYKHSR